MPVSSATPAVVFPSTTVSTTPDCLVIAPPRGGRLPVVISPSVPTVRGGIVSPPALRGRFPDRMCHPPANRGVPPLAFTLLTPRALPATRGVTVSLSVALVWLLCWLAPLSASQLLAPLGPALVLRPGKQERHWWSKEGVWLDLLPVSQVQQPPPQMRLTLQVCNGRKYTRARGYAVLRKATFRVRLGGMILCAALSAAELSLLRARTIQALRPALRQNKDKRVYDV